MKVFLSFSYQVGLDLSLLTGLSSTLLPMMLKPTLDDLVTSLIVVEWAGDVKRIL